MVGAAMLLDPGDYETITDRQSYCKNKFVRVQSDMTRKGGNDWGRPRRRYPFSHRGGWPRWVGRRGWARPWADDH